MVRILGMLQTGATQRYATAQFGVTQSVVQRIWQRFQDTGSNEERPKGGRPRKTPKVDDQYIIRGTDKSPIGQKPTRTKAHWTNVHC